MLLEKLALLLDGEIVGNKNLKIKDFNSLKNAKSEDITFAFFPKEIEDIKKSEASVIICPPIFFLNWNKTYIFTQKSFEESLNIVINFFKTQYFNKFFNVKKRIGDNSIIMDGAIVEEGVIIGKNCIIRQNVVIKSGTIIGNNVEIDCGAIIGAESFFGYKENNNNCQILGLKGVLIEDNVYIGANSTIEKGVLSQTKIGKHTKVGSLVTIAHDTVIGENCRFVSQTGIASNCRLGNNVLMYGQVGMANDVEIGNNVTVFAKSGIKDNIEDNQQVSGIPAFKHKDNIKMIIKNRRDFYKNGKKNK